MTLANLTVAKATIKTPDGEFSVRGLSLTDIMALVRKNRTAARELFTKFVAGGDANLGSAKDLGLSVLDAAPDFAAEIIALGAGEPEAIEVARHLGFPIQIEALERIGELTFASSSPKKVVETIIRVIEGTSSLLADLETSKVGSGVSGGK